MANFWCIQTVIVCQNLSFVIMISASARGVPKTTAGLHEQRAAEARVRQNAPHYLDAQRQITEFLTAEHKSATKDEIYHLAQRVSEQSRIPLDRAANRRKDCLICWFCEFPGGVVAALNTLRPVLPPPFEPVDLVTDHGSDDFEFWPLGCY
jgi:hypothetical protein